VNGVKFARRVFLAAGVYGLLVITPLYFLEGWLGRQNPPAITHPEFYYGFAGVALAWEIAFLVIAGDPLRFRPLIWPAMLEKLVYPAAATALYMQRRLDAASWLVSLIDLIFLALFAVSWLRTREAARPAIDPGTSKMAAVRNL